MSASDGVGPDVVRGFLDSCSTLTLALSDEAGPWAADVYFVRRARDLCFFSSPDSRHARAFTANPRAAGTVHASYEGWEDIRGVQLSGRVVSIASPLEKARVLAAYLAKFPFAKALLEGAGEALRAKVRFYRLVPEQVLWVDNSRGFGTRDEVRW